jgi:hypothetical protein
MNNSKLLIFTLLAACTARRESPAGDSVSLADSAASRAAVSAMSPAASPTAFPPVGVAVRDTASAWCAAFPRDSTAPPLAAGHPIAIVGAMPTGAPALIARVARQRTAECHAEFAQPRWSDYVAYDLVLNDSLPPGAEVSGVALAVASAAPWTRDPDGRTRADLDGDGSREEARRCAADEGEHFTIWSPTPNGTRARRAHEYYDWGALVDPTCAPGDDGRD